MSPARTVRLVGIVEGISWLVLLLIAMPLKYGFGLPLAVRITGSIHGALFVGFVIVLAWAHFALRWSWLRSAALFAAALIPFGFIFVDRTLKEESQSS